MLDNMQKAVLSCGVEYARALVISRTSKVPPDFDFGNAEAGSVDQLKKTGNLKNISKTKSGSVKNISKKKTGSVKNIS